MHVVRVLPLWSPLEFFIGYDNFFIFIVRVLTLGPPLVLKNGLPFLVKPWPPRLTPPVIIGEINVNSFRKYLFTGTSCVRL